MPSAPRWADLYARSVYAGSTLLRSSRALASRARAASMRGPQRDITPLPDLTQGRSRAGRCASAARLRRSAAALQRGLSGRGEHPGMACACCRPASTSWPGGSWSRTIRFPAIHGRVCYHPCESVCNRAEPRQRRVDPRGRAVPRRPRARAGWQFDPPPARERQAGARDRCGPERTVGRLPPAAAGSRGRDPRRGRRAGRDDALRHPGLPAAA